MDNLVPPVILLAVFTLILCSAWTGSIKKADDMLEPICTQTLPSLFPDNLPNLSEMYVHWDFSKIQTGKFPR